jgi:hypothetical protein
VRKEGAWNPAARHRGCAVDDAAGLAMQLSAHVAAFPAATLLTNEWGGQLTPWTLGRSFRSARAEVEGVNTSAALSRPPSLLGVPAGRSRI